MNEDTINLSEWYTAAEALARLEANSGRKLDESTPRQISRPDRTGHTPVQRKLVGTRYLYWKEDIDNYVVETRGVKVARKQRQRGLEGQRQKKSTARGQDKAPKNDIAA